ncbi:helix-turn-helix transcriptional regulator [uncultured Proteiniphilum sp.]|uniref:helix-turn-helix domain-containing protein n=1 Tax=uncultured Proteiniphilum sp. TaxID=497637 RepID=UPI000E8B0B2F|nr:helix-turn-helix transcriptional regulator [uncultured Proteiniphilum sp.]HBN04809.1 transcriptional regulator [Bacteroidales bacterium]
METKEQTLKNTHHGHAVKRFRHALGIKQEVLADMMGTTQARVSNCEQKKVLEDEVIDKFAKALNVAPELIKELEEDPVTVIIENNRLDNNSGSAYNYIAGDNIINNPIDKIAELFERLLEKEQEKIVLLEKLLGEKK